MARDDKLSLLCEVVMTANAWRKVWYTPDRGHAPVVTELADVIDEAADSDVFGLLNALRHLLATAQPEIDAETGLVGRHVPHEAWARIEQAIGAKLHPSKKERTRMSEKVGRPVGRPRRTTEVAA